MSKARPTTLSDVALALGVSALFAYGVIVDVVDAPLLLLDITRAVAIIGAVYILVAALVVVRVYYRNFRIAPEQARLLPRHVLQLGGLVVLMLASAVGTVIDNVAGPVVFYSLPLLLPAVFLGVFGLHDMLEWLPRRRPDLKPTGEGGEERRRRPR